MIPDEILYRCGSFDWVPLLGIWGAAIWVETVCTNEFSYREENYKKRVKEISIAWNQIRRMKRLSAGPMTTPEYKDARSRDECLQVIPSELEIVKQDFEKKSSELGKRIEKLQEENMYLKLDVDVQKSEAEKIRKEKRKIDEDRDSLKTEYKKIRLTMKNVGLGKTSEQWQQEVQEEKAKAEYWERKFREMQARNEALKKNLAESLNENGELKARVVELGRSLHHHRNRNSAIELRASLKKIEEMKGKIEELESALHSCELRIELLETREGHWKEELHHSHYQVRSRDYLMGEAIVQIREVADHLQILASQADTLSMKYELQFDHSQKLASLLGKIKTLGLRAKAYL
ncbi:golgin subfamily A member 5-like [Gossypium australe]|uniref:Golgin subfamily A member 5-like n=1 Tax=Gossypium australe TaxID=47621 RepID=A0A5B6WGP2_9ROSI|nr:golgin subfamily A member 5-like [Gossypium australe]